MIELLRVGSWLAPASGDVPPEGSLPNAFCWYLWNKIFKF